MTIVVLACIIFYGKFIILSSLIVKLNSKNNSQQTLKIIFLAFILVFIYSIFAPKINRIYYKKKSANRLAEIMNFERTPLAGRLPMQYINFSNLSDKELNKLEKIHQIFPLSPDEEKRIKREYIRYTTIPYNCYRLYKIGSKSPPYSNTKIPKERCKKIPKNLPEALKLESPVLFLLSGGYTKMRDERAGIMNEVRLITQNESLLIEYYEMRPREELLELNPTKSMFQARYNYNEKLPEFDFFDSVLATGDRNPKLRSSTPPK